MSYQILANKFLDPILSEFPDLQKQALVDITDDNKFKTLDDYNKEDLINFDNVKRLDLYKLSMLIEKHAQNANEPLIAVFETEHLYKYVEKRYIKILENVPKAWIIGGFDNPFFAPQTPPEKAEILTCAGTNLQDTWIVISRGPNGLFGLVAEDINGVEKGDHFRGFYTTRSNVIEKVIQEINKSMMTNIDFDNIQ